jgi:hypothetical protein
MGGWYWIGVCAGLGAAVGVLLAGVAGRAHVAAALAAAAGVGIGFAVHDWRSGGWADVAVGAIGGLLGGTRAGTGVLVGGAALMVAGLAWVPVLGYVEALALPALAARLRYRAPERYAGLRTLARN